MRKVSTSFLVWNSFVAQVLLFFAISSAAQSTGQKTTPIPPPRPTEEISAEKGSPSEENQPPNSIEEEMRAERNIKLAEKEYQDNISRAHEISKIASELHQSMQSKRSFEPEDIKRLERLEKLTKKIRGEAGGEADTEKRIDDRPSDISSTISKIQEITEALSRGVQTTPRQVVSAVVIDNANVLLELIRCARTFVR
jgi:hypothetical protein